MQIVGFRMQLLKCYGQEVLNEIIMQIAMLCIIGATYNEYHVHNMDPFEFKKYKNVRREKRNQRR